MKKIMFTCILLFFYSSYGISEDFNQQIEDFDKYINESNALNRVSDTIDLKPHSKPESKQRRKPFKEKELWGFLTKEISKGTVFYKVVKKGKKHPLSSKKTITYKIDNVVYKANGKVSVVINGDNITALYSSLPMYYQRLMSTIGGGGSALIYSSESNVPPRTDQEIKCSRVEIMSASISDNW